MYARIKRIKNTLLPWPFASNDSHEAEKEEDNDDDDDSGSPSSCPSQSSEDDWSSDDEEQEEEDSEFTTNGGFVGNKRSRNGHIVNRYDDDDKQQQTAVTTTKNNNNNNNDGKATTSSKHRALIGDAPVEYRFSQQDMETSSWISDGVLRSVVGRDNERGKMEVRMVAQCIRDMFQPDVSPTGAKLCVGVDRGVRFVCLAFTFAATASFSLLKMVTALQKLKEPVRRKHLLDVIVHPGGGGGRGATAEQSQPTLKLLCNYLIDGDIDVSELLGSRLGASSSPSGVRYHHRRRRL